MFDAKEARVISDSYLFRTQNIADGALHSSSTSASGLALYLEPSSVREREMGSSGEAMRAAKVYRDLLKAVKKHVGKEEHKSHFLEFISNEFRKSPQQSSIHHKLKLARDYTFLLNSVHHHKDLLFSYNIAVDRSEEMKRVLGKSAASVGLQLPEVYQP